MAAPLDWDSALCTPCDRCALSAQRNRTVHRHVALHASSRREGGQGYMPDPS